MCYTAEERIKTNKKYLRIMRTQGLKDSTICWVQNQRCSGCITVEISNTLPNIFLIFFLQKLVLEYCWVPATLFVSNNYHISLGTNWQQLLKTGFNLAYRLNSIFPFSQEICPSRWGLRPFVVQCIDLTLQLPGLCKHWSIYSASSLVWTQIFKINWILHIFRF